MQMGMTQLARQAGMSEREYQFYVTGRQSRRAGHKREACNVDERAKRGFWLAGWHDEDIERGGNIYFTEQRRAA